MSMVSLEASLVLLDSRKFDCIGLTDSMNLHLKLENIKLIIRDLESNSSLDHTDFLRLISIKELVAQIESINLEELSLTPEYQYLNFTSNTRVDEGQESDCQPSDEHFKQDSGVDIELNSDSKESHDEPLKYETYTVSNFNDNKNIIDDIGSTTKDIIDSFIRMNKRIEIDNAVIEKAINLQCDNQIIADVNESKTQSKLKYYKLGFMEIMQNILISLFFLIFVLIFCF